MPDDEFEAVRRLSPLERYSHFVGRVTDWRVFPIWDEGAWVMGADELAAELRTVLQEDYGEG